MSAQKTFTGRIAIMYMGCEMRLPSGNTYTLSPSHFPSNWENMGFTGKPILLSPHDLTEDQERHLHSVEKSFEDKPHTNIEMWAALTLEYCNMGVDVFNLIPAGLAERKQP